MVQGGPYIYFLYSVFVFVSTHTQILTMHIYIHAYIQPYIHTFAHLLCLFFFIGFDNLDFIDGITTHDLELCGVALAEVCLVWRDRVNNIEGRGSKLMPTRKKISTFVLAFSARLTLPLYFLTMFSSPASQCYLKCSSKFEKG